LYIIYYGTNKKKDRVSLINFELSKIMIAYQTITNPQSTSFLEPSTAVHESGFLTYVCTVESA